MRDLEQKKRMRKAMWATSRVVVTISVQSEVWTTNLVSVRITKKSIDKDIRGDYYILAKLNVLNFLR